MQPSLNHNQFMRLIQEAYGLKSLSKAVILSGVGIGLLIFLSSPVGNFPAIGPFFDPSIGFWRVAWLDDIPPQARLCSSAFSSEVNILTDYRGVPHIFGDNEQDVCAALGYLHARDRLWQMDIQHRFAAGRLSEIMGRRTLSLDLEQRRLGLAITAQRIAANLDRTSKEFQLISAYTNGVNCFIDQLTYKNYPYEFKLLHYTPESWTVEKTILVSVFMGYLSRNRDDLDFARLQQLFSEPELTELYPLFSKIAYPIIPEPDQLAAPQLSGNNSPQSGCPPAAVVDGGSDGLRRRAEVDLLGSNNWVVAGAKTATGKPMLANDPHLTLELPSLWYEAHLNCPQMNVYGVTLIGAPVVIIGFNERIAWGMTNCGWDVTDWYRETFDNQQHDHYWFNNHWRPVTKISQTIRIKNEPDTTFILEYTHRGPVIPLGGDFLSMRWTGNDTLFEGITALWLNFAQDYGDFCRALARYNCPAQNFVYADVDGNIAIYAAGKNPIRRSGLGRTIADGRDDQFDWIGFTPFAQLPACLNPNQGYLASTNQQPLNQPAPYFGWNWPADYRGRRINELLASNDSITVADMMRFQTDAYSICARVFVPYILGAFDSAADSERSAPLDSMLFYLRSWNYEMRKREVGATIFHEFMQCFERNTWQDHLSAAANSTFLWPSLSVLERITTAAPNSRWFDDIRTATMEDRDAIIRKSLRETAVKLSDKLGSQVYQWRWEHFHRTHIQHLSKLKPLGIAPFPNNGGNGTLNVGHGRINHHGPSWRMIVSLEQPIRGWGVYPGGQSGHPTSHHYCDFLATWQDEAYFELLFPKTMADLADSLRESKLVISPEERR